MKTQVFFGGAFDPFHLGHASLIEAAYDYFKGNLTIQLVVTATSAQDKQFSLGTYHRIALLEEVVALYDYVTLNLCEFELPAPSYSVNTLAFLNQTQPVKYLLIGEDQWNQFSSWHQASYLMNQYKILVGRRLQDDKAVKKQTELPIKQPIYLENALFDCASSMLKTKELSDWKGKVPGCVLNYVKKHQLLGATYE